MFQYNLTERIPIYDTSSNKDADFGIAHLFQSNTVTGGNGHSMPIVRVLKIGAVGNGQRDLASPCGHPLPTPVPL